MNILEAITEAVDSLDINANETYEQSELEDPDIKAWQDKKFKAINKLNRLKKEIEELIV